MAKIIIVLLGILSAVLLLLLLVPEQSDGPDNKLTALSERVQRLEARLASLEKPIRTEKVSAANHDRVIESNSRATRDEGGNDAAIPSIEAVASLKQQIGEMRKHLAQRGILPPDERDIGAAVEIVLAPNAQSTEKLSALRLLRSADSRTDEVVLSMIDVYDNEPDARIRADIFRQLDGVTTPSLKEPLLDAVAEEQEPDVREEAAETLAHYLPDETVRRWLEYLVENDPSEGVRRQAERSLSESAR